MSKPPRTDVVIVFIMNDGRKDKEMSKPLTRAARELLHAEMVRADKFKIIELRKELERKDALIEQMQEALKAMLRYPMLPIELDEIAEAALAAERGEK